MTLTIKINTDGLTGDDIGAELQHFAQWLRGSTGTFEEGERGSLSEVCEWSTEGIAILNVNIAKSEPA